MDRPPRRRASASSTPTTRPFSFLEPAAKTWYLDREEVALGIGPSINDNSWWSFGGVTPLGERPCILDDSYTFNPDGTWEKNTNGTLFMDSDGNGGWLGIEETCLDESEPGLWNGPMERT